MKHYCTNEQWAMITGKYRPWSEVPTSELDAELIGVLNNFNSMPGIITLGSCASHPDGWKSRDYRNRKNYLYVLFCCNQEGHDTLTTFRELLMKEIIQRLRQHEVSELEYNSNYRLQGCSIQTKFNEPIKYYTKKVLPLRSISWNLMYDQTTTPENWFPIIRLLIGNINSDDYKLEALDVLSAVFSR